MKNECSRTECKVRQKLIKNLRRLLQCPEGRDIEAWARLLTESHPMFVDKARHEE